ncbi:MAG: carbohydrate ABC transporter permease [Treponema sp.]|jgi:raffinose/stachyose/melibiose transport system permease protein|nr:carbohydrate ABC transporter permease [Treponema sp.]
MADIRKTGSLASTIMYAIVIAFTIMAVYPVFWVIMSSFKTTQEYMRVSKLSLPTTWFYRNYSIAWRDAKFTTLTFNSIFYTGVTVVTIIILSFMAGFAFAKLPSKATPILHGSFIIGILISLQCIMVPLFMVINTVGLFNTRLGVLIPYIGMGLPMAVYLATEYIKGIHNEIIESARIDGATYLRIFVSVIMPMAAPVATTVAILTTTGTWNEFMFINVLVSSDRLKTLPVGINMFSGPLATDYGKQFAALVIGMMPMIFFYILFRKQITKGVSAGAVKG